MTDLFGFGTSHKVHFSIRNRILQAVEFLRIPKISGVARKLNPTLDLTHEDIVQQPENSLKNPTKKDTNIEQEFLNCVQIWIKMVNVD